ncbi:MAG: hypothetical protein GC160_14375 [Acidobacteria bacterium]|nr:hypothetical protein [Acidobacteriota bacterium]
MSSEPDSPFEALQGRRFAFYPAIRGIEHNEWTLEQETWSEILAKNTLSGDEIWVPRNHLGELSSSDRPVMIVGLKRELQYRSGQISPYRKAVVEIPSAPQPRLSNEAEPEPPPPLRDSSTDSLTFSLIGRAILIALGVLFVGTFFAFEGVRNPIARLFEADTSTTDQNYLNLTAQDDYYIVSAKLGPPAREEWITDEKAELQFQALFYPERHYVVILMGGVRNEARYIGTVHEPHRKILDAARLSSGGDASAMMRNLPDF